MALSLTTLPDDLLKFIIYQLNFINLTSISCVSRKLNLLSDNSEMWTNKIGTIRPGRYSQFITKPVPLLKRVYNQISQRGYLIVKGKNKYGQLGVKGIINTYVRLPQFNNIIQVSCGEFNMGFVTDIGCIYTCGESHSPFIHDRNHWFTPRIPDSLVNFTNVLQVSWGWYHSAFITDQGEGYISSMHYKEPIRLLFEGFAIQIVSSEWYVVILTLEGNCYWMTLGNNDFSLTRILGDKKISKISAGMFHHVYLTTQGELYIHGSNDAGALGTIPDYYVDIPGKERYPMS